MTETKQMTEKHKVAVLGATGMVGQRMIERLCQHPFFEIAYLGASSRSAGKTYKEATIWRLEGRCPSNVKDQMVWDCADIIAANNKNDHSDSDSKNPLQGISIVFSALDSHVAGEIEQAVIELGKKSSSTVFVISNASNHRMKENVPLLIPEVNPHHLEVAFQSKQSIITNPNCCAIPFSLALAPLEQVYGIESVCVSTYQAVSGAGYPGESAWDMIGNVHPHSGNEEEKLQIEPLKILGTFGTAPLQEKIICNHSMKISARCVRVATADGHLLGLQVKLISPPLLDDGSIDIEEVRETLRNWKGHSDFIPTPSTPNPILELHDNRDRPSPRFDCNAGESSEYPHLSAGMAVSIGRLEPCPIMDIKMFALAHNTIRGAAGAAIANAELLVVKNIV